MGKEGKRNENQEKRVEIVVSARKGRKEEEQEEEEGEETGLGGEEWMVRMGCGMDDGQNNGSRGKMMMRTSDSKGIEDERVNLSSPGTCLQMPEARDTPPPPRTSSSSSYLPV